MSSIPTLPYADAPVSLRYLVEARYLIAMECAAVSPSSDEQEPQSYVGFPPLSSSADSDPVLQFEYALSSAVAEEALVEGGALPSLEDDKGWQRQKRHRDSDARVEIRELRASRQRLEREATLLNAQRKAAQLACAGDINTKMKHIESLQKTCHLIERALTRRRKFFATHFPASHEQ